MEVIKKIDYIIIQLDSIIYNHIETTHQIISSLYLDKLIDKKNIQKKEKIIKDIFINIPENEFLSHKNIINIKKINDLIFKVIYKEPQKDNEIKSLQYFENLQKQLLSTISEIKTNLTQIKNQHDFLTQLPMRFILMKDLEYFSKQEKDFYLGFIDIDFFKNINDKYGYDNGDLILKSISNILIENKNIKAYRYGGEEFVILILKEKEKEVKKVINQIHNTIKEKDFSEFIGNEKITISSGIKKYNKAANNSANQNINDASTIMKDVKNRGRDNFKII